MKMKIRNTAITTFIITAFLFSCTSGQKKEETKIKEGPGEIYWDDGSLKGKGNFKNFQKTGEWTLYHRGTKKKLGKGQYLNDKQEGQWIYFHKNGQKSTEGEFKEGQKTGKWIGYYDSGEKMWKVNYVIQQISGVKIPQE